MFDWIKFHCRDRGQWASSGGAAVRGSAFNGAQRLAGEPLAAHLSKCDAAAGFEQAVAGLNGFFAAIVLKDDAFYAAVDHARSIPLFYALSKGCLYLSDDAHWIRSRKADSSFDPEMEREFELAGYITGGDTICTGIKQLQAGELLVAKPAASGVELETKHYFRYGHLDGEELAEDELAPVMDEVLLASFRRLAEHAGGRPIAVPLSGGYDSLETVLMLKRLNYENLLVFSYGRAGNPDSRASESRAKAFGLRWEFVLYTEELWREWFASPERKAFYPLADNLCSLPILQDWPAVWQLKQRGAIPDDALIVPGYGADAFPASRKTAGAAAVYRDEELVEATVLNEIYKYTYLLWDWDKQGGAAREFVDARIRGALGDFSRFSKSAYAVEAWGIQERQAKFITNAVRAYDYWGHDWWLPLWDREFVEFWMRVPLRHRILRRFSRGVIAQLYQRVTGEQLRRGRRGAGQAAVEGVAALLRRVAARVPAVGAAYNSIRARMKYQAHPLAWYGMIPRPLFLKHFRGRVNINSFLAMEWLGRMHFGSTPVHQADAGPAQGR